MIIIYSKHSLERMHQRGISKETVELTILRPDRTQYKVEEKVAIKTIDKSVVIVVFKEMDDVIFVITTYKSSKISRYIS
ncbi:MAG: DUF4258 domain-containing protein [Cuniculiplasma sp.]|nr:MAG: hypothetical protein AMDU5_GPLC00015G0029 [Thermoplasmatales archaeon Gpl]